MLYGGGVLLVVVLLESVAHQSDSLGSRGPVESDAGRDFTIWGEFCDHGGLRIAGVREGAPACGGAGFGDASWVVM
jgi:hypothetical protein